MTVTLPDGSGFDLCEEVRKKGGIIPIIFLTAADEEVHVIRGLDSGGDDYITKPFRLGELFSRIHALLRRSAMVGHVSSTPMLSSGDVTIDLVASRAFLRGQPLE